MKVKKKKKTDLREVTQIQEMNTVWRKKGKQVEIQVKSENLFV